MIRLLTFLLLIACGSDETVNNTPAPKPDPGGPPGGDGKITYSDMEVLHDKYCIACHATGFTESEAALRGSSAKTRVQNKSMPPPNAPVKMSDKDRELYLSFFFE